MPQDGSKSVVYRSFFSCEDPKGVAECKTIRKSKTGSPKLDHNMEQQKKHNNSCMSFSNNEERKDIVSKRPTDDLHNPSSVQLMEISRGAQKLNQVIDTWSKGINFDRQSKDIAKDLLRGALDLQESLAMLGKLQEASQYMAKLKRKQKEKEKLGGGKIDAVGIERTTSDRFGYLNHNIEFQKPRLSLDGTSRDCFEELREAIREGLAKQNLLPKSSAEEKGYSSDEKAYFDRTKSYTEKKAYFDRAKSYSEQKVYFDRPKSYPEEKAYFDRAKSYSEERVYFERPKLDLSQEFPSTSSSQSSIFHSREFDTSDSSFSKSFEEKPKGPNVIAKLMGLEEIPPKALQSTQQTHGRPIFDIDLPKPRRPHFSVQKVDSQRRTLEELIETVQFRGLMTSKSTGRAEHEKQPSYVSDRKKRFADDAPPIVIIKPLYIPVSLEENLHKQKYVSEELDNKEVLRKWKTKERVPPKTINNQKGALNISQIQRKLQGEIAPLKRLSQEKGDNNCGDAFVKTNDRAIKIQENLPVAKPNAPAPVKPKVQKKEVTENKVDKIQRVVPNTKKPIELETTELKEASKSRKPNKLASTSQRKPEREYNFSKNQVSQRKGTASNLTSERSTPTASHSSSDRKKSARNEKKVSRMPSAVLVERKSKNDNIQSYSRCEDEHNVTTTQTSPEQLPEVEVKDYSGNLDDTNISESSLSNSTELIIHQKNCIKSTGDVNCSVSYNSTENRRSETSNATRNLLLDSASFLNQAEELFHTNVRQPLVSHTTSLQDFEMTDTNLILDCAKELLENKNVQCTLAGHSLLCLPIKKSRIFISLDQLVGEVCEGIEDLRSYWKIARETLVTDTLYAMLRKDIWCKGVVSGSWDLGWRKGFTQDEIEQIVVDMEQIILSGVMEDVVKDFAL